MGGLRHIRVRWPEAEAPEGEPLWLLYELDELADVVTRTIDIFPDGTVNRNSIVIEQRNGRACRSLIGASIAEAFEGVDQEEVSGEAFEQAWRTGEDTPFWNVR